MAESPGEPAHKKMRTEGGQTEESLASTDARCPPSTSSPALTSPTLTHRSKTQRSAQASRGGTGAKSGGKGRSRGDDSVQRRQVGWNDEEAAARRQANQGESARLPKRKCALYVGYCGSAYNGLQINPSVTTIEGTLFEGLVAAGCISKDNSDDPSKVALHRAARTDAGVHAAINVLSLKLILDPPSKAPDVAIEDHVNAHLPADIRLWRVLRVQNSFNPRTLCDMRTYRYTFPTYLVLPPAPGTAMANKLDTLRASCGPVSSEVVPVLDELAAFWKGDSKQLDPATARAREREWRASPIVLDRLRAIAAAFKGSHNFFNFTIGSDFTDRSSTRVMRSLTVREIVVDSAGIEWVSVEILGQSFMLHQIRKMIGLLILMARSAAPASLVLELFGPVRVTIPKAPALGLRLERPHFDRYNQRILDPRGSAPNTTDSQRDPLDYPPSLLERVEAWATVNVEPAMRDDSVFADWLSRLDLNAGDELDYLSPRGVLPDDYASQHKRKMLEQQDDSDEADEAALRGGDAQDLEG